VMAAGLPNEGVGEGVGSVVAQGLSRVLALVLARTLYFPRARPEGHSGNLPDVAFAEPGPRVEPEESTVHMGRSCKALDLTSSCGKRGVGVNCALNRKTTPIHDHSLF
jgi:hypothetical protein